MINNCLNDETQKCIIPHLENTEKLLNKAIRRHDPSGGGEITLLPDLGVSANFIRMNGGFFTGIFVSWESRVPFVPVDTTVNSCGVSVYLLNDSFDCNAFEKRLKDAEAKFNDAGYKWNFSRGNHFIILGYTDSGQSCAVMHASADEYKRKIADMALYPTDNVWYKDGIKVISENFDGGMRYLRYISGSDAERFTSVAVGLKEINKKRMDIAAELLFGNSLRERLIYTPHYGMPNERSVAIGCSWTGGKYVLLTANGNDVFIVDQESGNDHIQLAPHGFGVELGDPHISFSENGKLYICGDEIRNDDDVKNLKGRKVRMAETEPSEVAAYTQKILEKCPGRICEAIHPAVTFSAEGLKCYPCRK